MGNGEWGVGSGEWGVGSGEWGKLLPTYDKVWLKLKRECLQTLKLSSFCSNYLTYREIFEP
ncbi:MAG: hypothetical protein KME64_18300 [Scytonematopsis contorta HA4267-MV1]|jgi:hypothetical protein|nr:hypothetical protein [Scytonematopsis contorta HA4267-MV1]